MKGTYQAPVLQSAGTFQNVTEGHGCYGGYGGYGGKKWKSKFYGFGFYKKFNFGKKYKY